MNEIPVPWHPGEKELFAFSAEDQKFYDDAGAGLPLHSGTDTDGSLIPCSCGPHSIAFFRQVCDIIKSSEPKRVLEIGFNIGYSASILMDLLPGWHLTSCDISDKPSTLIAAKHLNNKHGDRFKFIHSSSDKLTDIIAPYPDNEFGMAFIDGDHHTEPVISDIKVAQSYNVKYIFFDDFLPIYGPGTYHAILNCELKYVAHRYNMILAENPLHEDRLFITPQP